MQLAERVFAIVALAASLTGCTAADWAAAFQPQPGYVRAGGPPPGTAQCVFCKGYYANVFEHQRATGCSYNAPASGQPVYQQQPTYQQPASQVMGRRLSVSSSPAGAGVMTNAGFAGTTPVQFDWMDSPPANRSEDELQLAFGSRQVVVLVNVGASMVFVNASQTPALVTGGVLVRDSAQQAGYPQQPFAQPQGQPSQMAPDLWAQNAIGRLQRSLLDPNFKQNLAAQIQVHTHPSGNTPSLGQAVVGRAMGSTTRVVATFSVNWRGGVVGSAYTTQVQWIFSQSSQESLTITGDNAPTAVADSNKQQLASYFRQLYDELKLQIR